MTVLYTNTTDLTSIADAIRETGGTSAELEYPGGFITAINNIDTGDGGTTYSDATTLLSGLMSASDKTKLDGIETGAEVNVQSDWNETDTVSDAYIANKPTIPSLAPYRTAAAQDVIDATKQDTLTTAQLAAANSGITSADKTKLDGIATSATNTSVSATGTATDEVQYITINGVEKKLAGGGGGGIWGQITGDLNDQQDLHNALSAKQDGLTAGSGISIIDNIISAIIATQGNAMFSFDVSNDNLYLNATDTALTEFTFSIDANGNLIMEYEEV